MALTIPSYPNPYSTTPLANAFGWISTIRLEIGTGQGSLTLSIHPDAASANAGLRPATTLGVALGDTIDNTDPAHPVRFPTLAGLMADAQFAAAFGYIKGALETNLIRHAALAGATSS